MSETTAEEAPGAGLLEHPAVRAWAKLRPGARRPTAVVRLQKRTKATVYRLEGAGPGGSDLIAKRSSPERVHRERAVYEEVLPLLPVRTVRYHGFVEGPDGEGCWLFVEDAGGEGYSPCSAEHRALAGRWLGLLHTSAARLALPKPEDRGPRTEDRTSGFLSSVLGPRSSGAVADRGPDYYLDHLHSGRETILRHQGHTALTPGDVAVLAAVVLQCESVADNWGRVRRWCATMPCTFIHGDFAPKNLRVRPGPALVPFDWGSAGWGVPAADLVQAGAGPEGDWDYWASPELAAYCAAARGAWPSLDATDLRGFATVGKIFRCLTCIALTARSLATPWVERALRNMAIYRAQLADAIREAGWQGA
jgi:hypothetical protein